MRPILRLPQLPNGTPQSNLAGILPLSSLIELIDVETRLHCYELSGYNVTWNWPITPAGARLMLRRFHSGEDRYSGGCLLDDGQRSLPLQCIDMRIGNVYPCINSFTVRACAGVAPLLKVLQLGQQTSHRLQRLEVVHVYCHTPEINEGGRMFRKPLRRIKWLVVVLAGWAAWSAAIVTSVVCAMPLALAYLLILPVTGFCVGYAFGRRPRPLLVEPVGRDGQCWRRSVLVANHLNEIDWTIYIGDSRVVNALLNKPLLRSPDERPAHNLLIDHGFLRVLLQALIGGQWGLVLAASALQDWDAIIISAALVTCAFTSNFLFRTSDSVNSWLNSNNIGVEKMSVTFSGRRTMLSALVAINPECQPRRSLFNRWVNPVLERTPHRDEWERLLQKRLLGESLEEDKGSSIKWLVECVEEGVQKASEVNKWLLAREQYHHVPARPPSQTPFVIVPPKLP